MKFLIICFGTPGELLLTTPALRALKQQAGTEIHYLLLPSHQPALELNPYIERFHFPEGNVLSTLEAIGFDHVLDWQHDDRTATIAKILKKPVTRYRKLAFRQFLHRNLKWNLLPPHPHIVNRFLETAEPFGARNDGSGLDFSIPHSAELNDRDIPASHHYGFVAMTVGSAGIAGSLRVAQLQQLCKAIDIPVMLLGRSGDAVKAEAIAAFDPVKVYNACGKFNFHETADLIRKSRVLITHDNTAMQVAAALKKPLVALWGNRNDLLVRGPWYDARLNLADHMMIKKWNLKDMAYLVNQKQKLNP